MPRNETNIYNNSLSHKIGAIAGCAYLNLMGKTAKIKISGDFFPEKYLAGKEKCIFATWHSQMLQMIFVHKNLNIATLVSKSKDGEYIARVLEKFGFLPVRGSSSKRALRSVLEMIKYAKSGHSLAITPDGPRGPRNKVQPGIIYLAKKTQLPIIPIGSAVRGKIQFGSWDRFELPFPLSKIVIKYGNPLHVSEQDNISEKALSLEIKMNRLCEESFAELEKG